MFAGVPREGVSTHSRPKAAGGADYRHRDAVAVSTHSRPKAAGSIHRCRPAQRCRFNSQPPEGGWAHNDIIIDNKIVSTHSRPKAAGFYPLGCGAHFVVSTHSRPKAAG